MALKSAHKRWFMSKAQMSENAIVQTSKIEFIERRAGENALSRSEPNLF